MKEKILFLCVLFCFECLYAQTVTSSNAATLNGSTLLGKGNVMVTFNERYDGIEGNRFFHDEKYHEGELWLTGNRHFTNQYKYKFDQLAGTIQVEQINNDKEILINIEEVLTFQMFINDKIVTFVKIQLPNDKLPSIVQIIYWSPKIKLVRDIKKKLIREKESNAYSTGKVYDRITNDYRYFFAQNIDPLESIKPNKKGFIKVLPKKENEIERLFKTKEFKDDLTVSKLAELMQKLEDDK
jgi:hypothetical protein